MRERRKLLYSLATSPFTQENTTRMITVPTSPLDLVATACNLPDYESMIRGIFAQPDDDLSRFIFADWLDDHGFTTWAHLIRLQTQRKHPVASALTDFEECQIVQPL